ncbi:riboflavin kinase [Candidatus Uhrbacteria bacterium]|nr:riboflavin kinase [Candidatus Uhrbacteria bacterium]
MNLTFSPSAKHWVASPISGSGRGRHLQVPTLNLPPESVPSDLAEGIYACRILLHLDDKTEGPFDAAMHYGPRPVFKDSKSCEVHLIDRALPSPPDKVTVEVVGRIRDVEDFASAELLKEAMQQDIEKAKILLKQ